MGADIVPGAVFPDYQLSDDGHRAAFHPYGKSRAQVFADGD